MKVNPSRRKFIRQLGSSSLLIAAGTLKTLAADEKNEERIIAYTRKISANDKIRIACIGMGIMGNADTDTALKVPGVELVAVSDLYTGRLERAKEKYGKDIYTTRDYRELLQRKDIDAVIIATSDNWHARISIDALNSGKAVYCEKPVVQKIADGLPVIQAQKKTKKPMQVGSQRVSSIVYRKAKELYKGGAIGQLELRRSLLRQAGCTGCLGIYPANRRIGHHGGLEPLYRGYAQDALRCQKVLLVEKLQGLWHRGCRGSVCSPAFRHTPHDGFLRPA